MSHNYYNNYSWYNTPDDNDDYSVFSGTNEMEDMEPDQVWETFRQDREQRPRDTDRAPRRYMNERLVQTVQNCEATCEHMTTYIMSLPDVRSRARQASLLRECADMCGMTAKMLARNSMIDKRIADLCARILRECGNECAKFSDAMSQQCSKICLETAGNCADYATV